MEEIIITESARSHNIADNDMIHALNNAITAFDQGDGSFIAIGPNQAANNLEIGFRQVETVTVIFHAMPARPKFLT